MARCPVSTRAQEHVGSCFLIARSSLLKTAPPYSRTVGVFSATRLLGFVRNSMWHLHQDVWSHDSSVSAAGAAAQPVVALDATQN